MVSINYSDSEFDATNMAIAQIYHDEQSNIINRIPKKIGYHKDIYNVKARERNKPKGAARLYSIIKKDVLFKIDQISKSSTGDTKELSKKIIDYLSKKSSKSEIKDTIKNARKSKDTVHELIILYDELTWFSDSNLLSTIRFHEKLNEIFLSKAEESLNYVIDKSKIEDVLKDLIKHPEYIKALITITLQPALSYGAIYASTQNDYEYIIKYESIVSEAAEILFQYDPALKMRFFQHVLA